MFLIISSAKHFVVKDHVGKHYRFELLVLRRNW